jgi:hypothetical protein
MSKKIFGRELLVDAYGCNVEALNSLDICAAFLKQAVVVLEVSEQSPPFVFVSPLKGPHGGFHLLNRVYKFIRLHQRNSYQLIIILAVRLMRELKGSSLSLLKSIFIQ